MRKHEPKYLISLSAKQKAARQLKKLKHLFMLQDSWRQCQLFVPDKFMEIPFIIGLFHLQYFYSDLLRYKNILMWDREELEFQMEYERRFFIDSMLKESLFSLPVILYIYDILKRNYQERYNFIFFTDAELCGMQKPLKCKANKHGFICRGHEDTRMTIMAQRMSEISTIRQY